MNYTIYAIQNTVNKKIYVGKTENPASRIEHHLSLLKNGKHPVEDMQEDYNKFGDVFDIFILESNVEYHDRHLEYMYMRKYRTTERKYGYNYKDTIAKRIHFDKPETRTFKSKSEIQKPFDDVKTKYISSIVEKLNKTENVEVLDFVLGFLEGKKE